MKIKVSELQRLSHCLSMHFHLIAAHNGSSIAERVFWSRKSFFKSQLLTPSSDFYSEKEYLYMSATSGHCLAPRECLSSTQSTSFEKTSWPMDEFQRLDTVHCTMSLANEFRGEIWEQIKKKHYGPNIVKLTAASDFLKQLPNSGEQLLLYRLFY